VSDAALLKAAAASLEKMAREVEEMGAELAGDPDIVGRHLGSLQSLDRWSQHLCQLASVIAADDPAAAVDEVTLGELRDLLRQAA
jgi:hypothetical protein